MARETADAIAFAGEVVEWRGPAPFYFVALPVEGARVLHAAARQASYGWGCVPVIATIDALEFRTSLIPRNGSFLLPLKVAVRRVLDVAPGDRLDATVRVAPKAHTS